MITKLKRFFSFLADLIIPYLIIAFCSTFLYLFLKVFFKSLNTNKFASLYVIINFLTCVMFYIFKSAIFKGQSPMQKLFRLKYECQKQWQLYLKNIIDLITVPISFLTIVFFNKSISEILLKIKCIDLDKTKEKDRYYVFEKILLGFYCIWFVFFSFSYSNRVSNAREYLIGLLGNSQTINEQIGKIEKLSYRDFKVFGHQDGKGHIIFKTNIINEDGQKFKVDIYYKGEEYWFSQFIIDGVEYEAEIEHFNLEETLEQHKEIVTYFQENYLDKYQGDKINSREDAVLNANNLWNDYFKDDSSTLRMNYRVYYDRENDCYMVYASIASMNSKIYSGGDKGLIIKSDGAVLAIWSGK